MLKSKRVKSIIAFAMSFTLASTVLLSPLGMISDEYVNAAVPNDLSISENGLQFIIDREGFDSVCFWDYAQWTIGYGTRCDGSGHPSNPKNLQKGNHTITKDAARTKFLSAIENVYVPGVRRRLSGVEMNQNQFDALVSLCYNAGEGRLAGSPLARYLRGEITKSQAYNDYCNYVVTAGGTVLQGLKNRRKLEADLFFIGVDDIVIDPPTVSEGCFQPCGSGYTSIVEALKSIGADSSYSYRAKIAAANGITGYSGTAEQNTRMLSMLKSGTLKIPSNSSDNNVPEPPPVIDYTATYFPACSSSFSSIVDALKSIGVDSSMSNRKVIAEANGISGYSGTAAQNTQMLDKLKSGKLINPNGTSTTVDTSGKYYPACSSNHSSIVDALKSIGVDSSLSNRKVIAAANGISGYSGTASQNTQMLNLLKSGTLIKADWVEPPAIVNYTVSLDANGGHSPASALTVASNSSYQGLPTASREGYTFNGWFTEAGGGVQIKDGSALVSASDHTLYAHWSKNTYKVSLDKNDGSGIVSSKNVLFGDAYGEFEAIKKSGYKLLGWFTESNGGNQVSSDSKYNIADNQTLYAHWEVNSYTVTFDYNGGTGNAVNKTVVYDDTYGTLEIPERSGYTFEGWFTALENGTKITSETIVSKDSDHILYAKWKIKGDANGDGVVSVSDISALQKWMLGISNELTNLESADLYKDGVINILDLIMLRKMLIEQ